EPRADEPCRGDMRCANIPGPPSFHCVNPDFDRKGVCPRAWRCQLEGRCFSDMDCDEGDFCEERMCQSGDEPVADVSVDVAVGPEDAGPLPDSSETDAQDIEVKTSRRSDGCSSMPHHGTPPWFWLAVLCLTCVRRFRLPRP
ncbi:MAG: hypothetical protein ACON3Z_05520, partial [Bradymonadia bacterium]